MEVRTVGVWHNLKCPYSGTGLAVVVEKTESSVHLFYPFTLEEWTMPLVTEYIDDNMSVEGYDRAVGDEYPHHAKIVAIIREQLRICREVGRPIPEPQTVAKVLAALEGRALSELESEIGSEAAVNRNSPSPDVQKMTRKLRLKKHEELAGRDAVIASVMTSLKVATVCEIVDKATPLWTGRKKTRQSIERHVVNTTNKWLKLGWVEAL